MPSAETPYDGLVVAHLLKAGGGQAMDFLNRGAVSCRSRERHRCALYEENVKTNEIRFHESNETVPPKTNKPANMWRPRFHDPRWFRIVLVREPCALLASMFRFQALNPTKNNHGHATLKCAQNLSGGGLGGDPSEHTGGAGVHIGRTVTGDAMELWRPLVHLTNAPTFHWPSYRMASFLLATESRPAQLESANLQFGPLPASCPALLPVAWRDRVHNLLRTFEPSDGRHADCWVRQERLWDDLLGCVRLYTSRFAHGRTRFDVGAMARAGSVSRIKHGVHARTESQEGGDPANQTGTSNATCARLFGDAPGSAAHVWRLEGEVATKLGYAGCCKGLAG